MNIDPLTNDLTTLPWELIIMISGLLDLRSIFRLSATARIFYLALSVERGKLRQSLPWRISAEYHFNGFDFVVHQCWIKIGWFPTDDEDCDHCWNGRSSSINSVRKVAVTGTGGLTLDNLIAEGPIIPLWFNVDIYGKTIIPVYIGGYPNPRRSLKIVSYFDEAFIEVGHLQEIPTRGFDRDKDLRLSQKYKMLPEPRVKEKIVWEYLRLYKGPVISYSNLIGSCSSSFLDELSDSDTEGYEMRSEYYDETSDEEAEYYDETSDEESEYPQKRGLDEIYDQIDNGPVWKSQRFSLPMITD